MTFFEKLFGKKKEEIQNNKSIDTSIHKEDWDFYFSNVDNSIGSFYVDLGLSKVAPLIDKPNLVWVCVNMNNPKENGLSSNDEFEKLSEIQNTLQAVISRRHNAIYAGRLTSNNQRNFYFYLGNPASYDKTITEAMRAFPSYMYEFGIQEDKEWKSYFEFMYPNPRQLQSIKNRRVIDTLKEQGDSLTKERKVYHWIYFKTQKDRESFLLKLKDEGFQIIDQNVEKNNVEFPYSLQIARVDNVDIDSVNKYTGHVLDVSEQCNGEYDGWETSVEKD